MKTTRDLTNAAFVLNMINYCVGEGLLVKPYALAISGWYSIISVSVALLFVIYSGYLYAMVTLKAYKININDHKYEMVQIESEYTNSEHTENESDPSENNMDIRQTQQPETNKSVFQILGKQIFGVSGEYYFHISTMIVWSVSCINIVIIGWEILMQIIQYIYTQNAILIMPLFWNQQFMFTYILLFVIPFIFILNWKQLTFVSKISVFSVTLLLCTMLYVFCLWFMNSNQNNLQLYTTLEQENIAQYAIDNMSMESRIFYSFLVFKGGITGGLGIPPLTIALKDKNWKNIKRLIFISYLCVAFICVSFGVMGAVIYANRCDVLILNNLFVWPSGAFIVVVVFVKLVNLWSSYGILLSLYGNSLSNSINIKNDSYCAYLVRLAIVLFTTSMAYLCRHHLAFMTGLKAVIVSTVGGALIAPLILYIAMFYKTISVLSKIFHILLLICTIFVSIFVLYDSISGFLY